MLPAAPKETNCGLHCVWLRIWWDQLFLKKLIALIKSTAFLSIFVVQQRHGMYLPIPAPLTRTETATCHKTVSYLTGPLPEEEKLSESGAQGNFSFKRTSWSSKIRYFKGSFITYVTFDKGEGVIPRKFRVWRAPRAGEMERDAGPKYTLSGQKRAWRGRNLRKVERDERGRG